MPSTTTFSPTANLLRAESAPSTTAIGRSDRLLLGAACIILSTLFMAGGDVIAKGLAHALPPIEIAWMRFASYLAIALAAALVQGPVKVFRTRHPFLHVARGLCLTVSALLFFFALPYLQVAEATAVFYVSPVFVTALSMLFLGEKIGIRRWSAAVVGFLGVMIVVRPGTSAFQMAALLPIFGALAWAVAIVVTSVIVPFVWVAPSWHDVMLGALVGLASSAGHSIVVVAYRHAEASSLAPFSYTQLIWAGGFAFLAFGTLPDAWTWAGAAVIAASGLYTAYRARIVARQRQAAAA